MLNPVAPLLEGLNSAVVLGRQPDLPWIGYSTVVALLLTMIALSFFRRLEPRFAESV
jgi:ABC-type polysaccharide/polyol phosphate export permease